MVSAYLGGWGIAEALDAGADVVITGRVTDAAIIVGPAAWHFGWARTDWDALAGAVAAGHVIECGAQATGGQLLVLLARSPEWSTPASPSPRSPPTAPRSSPSIAGTGGAVTVETVTAQLLYEIDGPRYPNPDVITRLDTARLEQIGKDRVRISGVRGEPAPGHGQGRGAGLSGGWRNEMTFVLTGTDIEAKAELAQSGTLGRGPGRTSSPSTTSPSACCAPTGPTRSTMNEAVALLTVAVADPSADRSAPFSRAADRDRPRELPRPVLHRAPRTRQRDQRVLADADARRTLHAAGHARRATTIGRSLRPPTGRGDVPVSAASDPAPMPKRCPAGPTSAVPLGTVLGARSGTRQATPRSACGPATTTTHRGSDRGGARTRCARSSPRLRTATCGCGSCRTCAPAESPSSACSAAASRRTSTSTPRERVSASTVRAKHLDIPTVLLPADGQIPVALVVTETV